MNPLPLAETLSNATRALLSARNAKGHWEGHLIKGARNASAVGSLVERTTHLIILAHMAGTDAGSAGGSREGEWGVRLVR